jgi:hypothetical protein
MDDQVQTYHARGGDIYHLDPLCPVGRQIPLEWRVAGSDGLALCPTCWARSKAKPPSGAAMPAPSGSPVRANKSSGNPRSGS